MKKNIPTVSPILTGENFAYNASLLAALNERWKPHPGQLEVGRAIYSGARKIFVECGRKWGKTEFAANICWRFGNMIKGGQIYYFGAYQKSVREFLWAPKRLQNFGPKEYIHDIHKTEMRLTFTSETFVKLDGADEFRVAKGFNPDLVILDEFADYPEDFWPAMSPNFASKDAIVIIISSPPWILETEPGKPVLFTRIADRWEEHMKKAAKAKKKSKYFYVNQPSHINTANLPPDWLETEEKELKAMGMEDIWEREYLAKRVVGGGKRIIGTFKREHIRPHAELVKRLEKNATIMMWVDAVDPSQSAFGAILIGINPYSKEVFFMDEVFETDENETTEHILWPRLKEKEIELVGEEDPERFFRVCDEAAKWWIVGCSNDPEIGISFQNTEKATNSVEYGISLLRSIFRYGKGHVSDRCKWFAFQLENWRKDKRGQIPEAGCDLIDASRYGLHALDYFITKEEMKEMPIVHPRQQRKLQTSPEQDFDDAVQMLDHDYMADNISEASGAWWEH